MISRYVLKCILDLMDDKEDAIEWLMVSKRWNLLVIQSRALIWEISVESVVDIFNEDARIFKLAYREDLINLDSDDNYDIPRIIGEIGCIDIARKYIKTIDPESYSECRFVPIIVGAAEYEHNDIIQLALDSPNIDDACIYYSLAQVIDTENVDAFMTILMHHKTDSETVEYALRLRDEKDIEKFALIIKANAHIIDSHRGIRDSINDFIDIYIKHDQPEPVLKPRYHQHSDRDPTKQHAAYKPCSENLNKLLKDFPTEIEDIFA